MIDQINIIKAYANESLSYGKKSGNHKATKRGNDVLYAAMQIEEQYYQMLDINVMIQANHKARTAIKDDMRAFAKRIDPASYDTVEEWKKAIRIETSQQHG